MIFRYLQKVLRLSKHLHHISHACKSSCKLLSKFLQNISLKNTYNITSLSFIKMLLQLVQPTDFLSVFETYSISERED